MGNHEVLPETMKDVYCFCCGTKLDPKPKAIGYGDFGCGIDFEVKCAECSAEYKIRGVPSYHLISQEQHYENMKKELKEGHRAAKEVKCSVCGETLLGECAWKEPDLSYLCDEHFKEKYGEQIECDRCERWTRTKLAAYTVAGKCLCPRCTKEVYGAQACFTCKNLDGDMKCPVRGKGRGHDLPYGVKELNTCDVYSSRSYGMLKVKPTVVMEIERRE